MMSIGVLGFVVWSRVMALPICEFWVINLTVSWKSFIPISTFNSENLIGYAQSAGNLSFVSTLVRDTNTDSVI